MQEGQLLLYSFSSVDIGFRSITFADGLISLEYISLQNTGQGIGTIIMINTVFFFCFFISDGWC